MAKTFMEKLNAALEIPTYNGTKGHPDLHTLKGVINMVINNSLEDIDDEAGNEDLVIDEANSAIIKEFRRELYTTQEWKELVEYGQETED